MAWITSRGKNYKTFVETVGNWFEKSERTLTFTGGFTVSERKSNPADLSIRCKDFVVFNKRSMVERWYVFI